MRHILPLFPQSVRWIVVVSASAMVAGLSSVRAATTDEELPPPPAAVAERLERWQAARFGLFIHWGPVSLKGTEIGWSRGAQVPVEEYDDLYRHFDPKEFDADAWMQVARDAGMKYVVFTTKHHDGFCLWDTRQTDFNIMRSPFGRDVVKELAAAARRRNLWFGTYHSVCDWHHPDFPLTGPGGSVRRPVSDLDRYEIYLRAQVSELITGYGPLHVMWFDVPQEFDARRGQRLVDLARSLQPDIIVNNRSGAPGDYDTPEQTVGRFQMDRPWETCMTLCQQWSWKPNDRMKSLEECVQTLVRCAGGDGNLLFNVGPMPDGRIEPRQVERLREMGAWLAKHGEAIYGTRGGPWKPTRTLASTRKDGTVYLHVLRWTGDTVRLPRLPRKVTGVSLADGGTAHFAQDERELMITVLPWDRREIDTIVKIDLDGPAIDVPPIDVPSESGVKATASNTFFGMAQFGPDAAFDGDAQTRWATDAGTRQAWIAADLGRPRVLEGVRIEEAYAGRVKRFEFQTRDGAEWKTVFEGTNLGAGFERGFPPVTAREVRLNVLEAEEGPTLHEIVVREARGSAAGAGEAASAATEPEPERAALRKAFLDWGFGMFLHFNLATFAGVDWATGHEDPGIFRPAKLDCGQWADTAKEAGMKYGVLTVKHTEGMALWDSGATTHDIAACRNFRDGRGDVVREFVEAFRARGLKVGFYYCLPGDYSNGRVPAGKKDLHGLPPEADGDPVGFMKRQLTELLTGYGPIDLLWIDQYANRYTADRWSEIRAHVRSLQPDCLVLANNAHRPAETDIVSYEFPWKPVLPPEGNTTPAEVSDTIQPGSRWFWDASVGPGNLRSAEHLVRMIRLCRARSANYLLNVPPDRDGLIPAAHVERLREVGRLLAAP